MSNWFDYWNPISTVSIINPTNNKAFLYNFLIQFRSTFRLSRVPVSKLQSNNKKKKKVKIIRYITADIFVFSNWQFESVLSKRINSSLNGKFLSEFYLTTHSIQKKVSLINNLQLLFVFLKKIHQNCEYVSVS